MYNKLQITTSEPSDRLRLGAAEAPSGPTASGLSKGSSSRRTATRKDQRSFDVGRRAGQ